MTAVCIFAEISEWIALPLGEKRSKQYSDIAWFQFSWGLCWILFFFIHQPIQTDQRVNVGKVCCTAIMQMVRYFRTSNLQGNMRGGPLLHVCRWIVIGDRVVFLWMGTEFLFYFFVEDDHSPYYPDVLCVCHPSVPFVSKNTTGRDGACKDVMPRRTYNGRVAKLPAHGRYLLPIWLKYIHYMAKTMSTLHQMIELRYFHCRVLFMLQMLPTFWEQFREEHLFVHTWLCPPCTKSAP